MQLKFKNGKFRVLQVSDPQDLQYVRHTMMRMLNKAYDDLKPDLIVLTGDNILGNHLDDARIYTPLIVKDKVSEMKAMEIAIDKLVSLYPGNTLYFPAYEIVLDELRDYRFYAEDMTHPSPLAVEYIWEKFSAQHITEESIALSNAIEEIARGLAHRPFDAESDGYRKFIANLLRKITQIKELHTHLDFEKDIERCNTLLNK